MRRGEYQQALECFKTAYQLVPSPRIHYNFGLVYMALGRPSEAVESFDRFLAGAIDADPEHVAQAHRHRAALSKKVGRLTVTCPVDGAGVVVDGRQFGTTPLPRAILLDPGPHLLLVEKSGAGSPFTHRFEITAGASIAVAARLGTQRATTEPPPTSAAATPTTPALPPVVSGAHTNDTPPLPPARDPRPPDWARTAGWVAAGAAAASIAFGAYEWSIKETKFKQFNNEMNACGSVSPGPLCQNLRADGTSAKRLGLAGFIAGGVLALGATGLFLWSTGVFHDAGPHQTAFGCAPIAGEAGFNCGWRF